MRKVRGCVKGTAVLLAVALFATSFHAWNLTGYAAENPGDVPVLAAATGDGEGDVPAAPGFEDKEGTTGEGVPAGKGDDTLPVKEEGDVPAQGDVPATDPSVHPDELPPEKENASGRRRFVT